MLSTRTIDYGSYCSGFSSTKETEPKLDTVTISSLAMPGLTMSSSPISRPQVYLHVACVACTPRQQIEVRTLSHKLIWDQIGRRGQRQKCKEERERERELSFGCNTVCFNYC